ncbi:hypothetical protein BIT18_2883 [Mycobacterium tuberculosis variant bovis]|nr:hypothetical protein BIT18_2883 [Mycobacterium tuberculosis variant bovis]
MASHRREISEKCCMYLCFGDSALIGGILEFRPARESWPRCRRYPPV